ANSYYISDEFDMNSEENIEKDKANNVNNNIKDDRVNIRMKIEEKKVKDNIIIIKKNNK
ncbi:10523_t:CDS:1, partial [Scutellospora calospora]